MAEEFLYGRNSVLEALKSARGINKIYLQSGLKSAALADIFTLAKEAGTPVEIIAAERMDALSGRARHQGVMAAAAPVQYYQLDEVLAIAAEKGEPPFLLLLDEVQDPQNMGAIIRTAAAAGVHGVLIPKRRSCQLSPAVSRASAGAVEYLPAARIGNVAQTLAALKKKGLWVIGADMAGVEYTTAELTGPIVLAVGGESKGLGRLVRESCDLVVSIPMLGGVSSLNVSAAGAILLYEALRQRRAGMSR